MHVAIIGAGIVGVAAANRLSKNRSSDLQLTLIDPKSYVEVPWATIRALFETDIAEGCTFPLAEWAVKRNINHRRASAKSLSRNSVTLDTDEEIKFDVCLIATGATIPVPSLGRRSPDLEVEARRKRMFEDGNNLISKRHVLIVGGGAVGTEFAGDIVDYAKRKGNNIKVTLVHSGDHLVPEFTPSGAARLQAKLDALGVRIVLNEHAVEKDGKWMLQSSGEILDVDEVITSVGIKPETSFLNAEGLSESLDEKGFVKVDDYFRVAGGGGRLFAAGDCCNILSDTANSALQNVGILTNNMNAAVAALEDGKDAQECTNRMKTKSIAPRVCLVTVGRHDGVLQTPLGATSFFFPAVKNRTMLLFKARWDLGF